MATAKVPKNPIGGLRPQASPQARDGQSPPAPSATRNKLIRLIQKGIRELGLHEPEYRGLYASATKAPGCKDGKDSLRDMDEKELAKVAETLRRYGFAPRAHKGDKIQCKEPQARKIRSLWLELKSMGVLRDPSEGALLRYIEKRTGAARMEWLMPNQIVWIIESLKNWVEREACARAAKAAGTPPAPNPIRSAA